MPREKNDGELGIPGSTFGRPVTGWIDVRYLDGKEFYKKLAEDCYWGADRIMAQGLGAFFVVVCRINGG